MTGKLSEWRLNDLLVGVIEGLSAENSNITVLFLYMEQLERDVQYLAIGEHVWDAYKTGYWDVVNC